MTVLHITIYTIFPIILPKNKKMYLLITKETIDAIGAVCTVFVALFGLYKSFMFFKTDKSKAEIDSVSAAENQSKEFLKEIIELRESYSALNKEMHDLISAQNERIRELEIERDGVNDEKAKMQQSITNQNERIIELERELDEAQSEIEKLKSNADRIR